MAISIKDKFISVSPAETRCPEKIRAAAPSAKVIHLLKERFNCSHWQEVGDLFHQVKGAYILTQPTSARKHFTLRPKEVIKRLVALGVW